MKKAIVLSILGIAASGYAAFGQGVINFNNYVAANYNSAQVLWGTGSGHASGTVVDTASVEVQLYYQLGTINESSVSFLADPLTKAGLTAFVDPTVNSGGAYGVGAGGYYGAGNQLLTGWSSGPVTFMVAAWDTTTGATLGSAAVTGLSALFQAQDDSPGTAKFGIRPSSLPAENFATISSVTLVGVPEPMTMALGGLGLAALMAFRRKQV